MTSISSSSFSPPQTYQKTVADYGAPTPPGQEEPDDYYDEEEEQQKEEPGSTSSV